MIMESLKNFIVENWQFISSAILALLSIIAIVVRRSKNVVVDDSISSKLVRFIDQAETLFGPGHGEDKKEYVMSLACESFDHVDDWFYKYISDRIEELLSLPTKKGGSGRESK